MRAILSAILIVLASPAAFAGETPWQDVMPDVSIRLVATNAVTDDNTTWIAVEIDMPETVKTYWRVPGESGIPPQFDFAGSNGIGAHEVAWPYPRREDTEYYLDHAYYGHTLLPIEMDLEGDVASVELNAVLGICSDICVPVSVDFSLDLDLDQPDRPNVVRMQQARTLVPIAWEGADLIGDVRFVREENALVADLQSDSFPLSSAIADIKGRPLLFGSPEASLEGNTVRFPLLGKAATDLAEGEIVHITFSGDDGPYEILRHLQISSP